MQTKLVQFTLLVAVNNRQREFNFRQRSPELYDGNTTDERGDRYYFTVVKENAQWKFGDQQMPAWLRQHEEAVIKALAEHE